MTTHFDIQKHAFSASRFVPHTLSPPLAPLSSAPRRMCMTSQPVMGDAEKPELTKQFNEGYKTDRLCLAGGKWKKKSTESQLPRIPASAAMLAVTSAFTSGCATTPEQRRTARTAPRPPACGRSNGVAC